MTKVKLKDGKSFVVQKQEVTSPRRPLKVHHLSHDLRGPLNSILGFTELLKEGVEGPINEIQAEDLAAIYQSASNLLHLIDAVVDLSKLENDRLILTFEPVQLAPIINHIVASQQERFGPHQIEIVVSVPESLPPLWGDRHRVEQMMMNLVRFASSMKQERQINLSVDYDEKDMTIEVTAPEVLIPSEQLAELFELIVEVNTDGRSKLGIGGLDLPLTYQLAKKQAGQMWVESHPGTGTTFYLKLPLHQPT